MPILYRTRGNAAPARKPRVYFTCHPADFDRTFEKIAADLTEACDCAVYYTPDMTEEIADRDTDLGPMNLFVIPVTFRLLTDPCRAMDGDFAFANREHIPVLPIMMETGIDEIYSRKDKFGERQYLRPDSADLTEISYTEKLRKYLASVLVSDETAARVRAAFDAYIFLSYRKKDRRCANELLRLIHDKPGFRDIAVWYDEFLTPGESFDQNIRRALADSKLFTLLVTPHVLEEGNFVLKEEYPAAHKMQMPVLPAEMEPTDPAVLGEKFADLPPCVDPRDEDAFRTRLTEALTGIARLENDGDPTHNFLIGLAYLDGIDVEVNRTRALELIKSAAEAGLPEAMEKLCDMYCEGVGVLKSPMDARDWAEKWVDACTAEYGEDDLRTHSAMLRLADLHLISKYGAYDAEKLCKKVYAARKERLGEEHPDTLAALHLLARALKEWEITDETAVKTAETVYEARCRVLGEDHPDTLASMNLLAYLYSRTGNQKKSLELNRKTYELRVRILGEEAPGTVTSLNNLAAAYSKLGRHTEALPLYEKLCVLRMKTDGPGSSHTHRALNNLAGTYELLGEYEKALEWRKKEYEILSTFLGAADDAAIHSLDTAALLYARLNDHEGVRKTRETLLETLLNSLGEEHPRTIHEASLLASACHAVGDDRMTLSLYQKVYLLRCRVLGEEDPDTLSALNNLGIGYLYLAQYEISFAILQKAYDLRKRVRGENHADTLSSLCNMAQCLLQSGEYLRAAALFEDVYRRRTDTLGKDTAATRRALRGMAEAYFSAEEPVRAAEAYRLLAESRSRALGSDHPDTRAAKARLAEILKKTGE